MRLAALLLGLALVVAGCSEDEPEPSPAPTSPAPSTSSVAATPSPTPSESTDMAAAVIRRWLEAGNEMQRTGDGAEYRTLIRGCYPCDDVVKRVEAIYAAGGYIRFDGESIRTIRRVKGPRGSGRHFEVDTYSPPTTYVEKAGGQEQSYPGGDRTMHVQVFPVDGKWLVVDYYQVPS
jgi:hypothetical protein